MFSFYRKIRIIISLKSCITPAINNYYRGITLGKQEDNGNKHGMTPNQYHQTGPGPYPHYPPPYMAEEDEIDLAELAGHFWSDRWLIAKITGAFVVLGILIALLSPVEYQTSAVLMPEMESNQGAAGSLLERYGGMLGISAPADMGNMTTIPPQLYPKIVESVPYQWELVNTPVTFAAHDTTVTAYTFFEDIYSPSLLSYLKGYTMGLPGKVISLFKSGEEEGPPPLNVMGPDSIYTLTEKQKAIIEGMRGRISVSQDQESGIVTLTVSMPDARAAAETGKAALQLLKAYVREYRTQKVAADLAYIAQQMGRARREFEAAQNRLAEFRDSNISLTSARAQTEQQELQSQYDLAFNLYNSLRQQHEQAKLKVQKSTPVFSVLQPVTLPLKKSEPNRKLIVIVSLLLGLIAGLGWSLLRGWGRDFVVEMRAKGEVED